MSGNDCWNKNVFSRPRQVAYNTYCTRAASLMEPPRMFAYTLYFYRLGSLTYILPQTVCVYFHSTFSDGPHKNFLFLHEGRFSRSRSSKVIDVGTNRKRVCEFLLVRNSNLALFRRCRNFYMLLTPALFHPNFGGVPVASDCPCWGYCDQGP